MYAPGTNINLGSASQLSFNYYRGEVAITRNNGVISQVMAPDCAANITQTTATKYIINFYYLTNITFDPSTGLFTVNSGAGPFAAVTIEDTDGVNNMTTQLLVKHELFGSLSTYTVNNYYQWESGNWGLSSGNGLRNEYTAYTTNNGTTKVATHYIYSGSGPTTAVWGVEMPLTGLTNRITKEFWGQGTERKETTYAYDASGNMTNVSRWDGSWEVRVYDSNKRLSKVYQPIMNNITATAANDQNCHYFEYTYTPCSGSGDDGSVEALYPRCVTERMSNNIVSKKYYVIKADERREIICLSANASWNDTANLVTIKKYYSTGEFINELKSIQNPDGTVELYEYGMDGGTKTTTTLRGQPHSTDPTQIINGSKSISYKGPFGESLQTLHSYIVNSSGNGCRTETYSEYDAFKRPGKVVESFDGSSVSFTTTMQYSCCGLSSTTDKEGITTSYEYDDLKRLEFTTKNNIKMQNTYDADGQIVMVSRLVPGVTEPDKLSFSQFDTAGRLINTTNAMLKRTQYAESVSNGILTKTTTYPDEGTRIETYYPDGNLKSITGSAVHGISNYYGAGSGFTYVVETKLKSDGSPSSEWKKTWKDMAGRVYQIDHSGMASEGLTYNQKGQLATQTDADGVKTLYEYDGEGQLEYKVLDWDRDGVRDGANNDRIMHILRDVVYYNNMLYKRTQTRVWHQIEDESRLSETVEVRADDLHTKRTVWNDNNVGLISETIIAYNGNGNRTETQKEPDGKYTVSQYSNGRVTSVTHYGSGDYLLDRTTYGYDDHGRVSWTCDTRTGTYTSYGYNNADQPIVNVYYKGSVFFDTKNIAYDDMGRLWTYENGSAVTTNLYHLTGELAMRSGYGTYPVAYGYDFAGRMSTMTNWGDFGGKQGTTVTTWQYDALGHMTNKIYGNTSNVVYTYTSAGRLLTRQWSRGVTTTYTTNAFGEIITVAYSDGLTPSVSITYDRLGRRKTMTHNNVTTTFTYNNAGALLNESYSGGVLSGISINQTYNSVMQPETLSVQGVSSGSIQTTYGFLNSRLNTVTHSGNTATYSYWPNSSLVSSIVFNNGSTDKMTESRAYDDVNRLTEIKSVANGVTVSDYDYVYNALNQRTRIDIGGTSPTYVSIDYDNLGQVTNAAKYWSDNSLVAGQQASYKFDDIGNRKTTTRDGRVAEYANNNVNQITVRTVPRYLNVIGEADSAATVKVNGKTAERKGTYYRTELRVPNATPLCLGLTNVAIKPSGSEENYVSNLGSVYVPPANENFTYDGDGNLTSDGLWNYTWDGENRLLKVESRTTVAPAARYKVEWGYDALGRRVSETTYNWNTGTSAYALSTTVLYVYDGWQCIGELNTGKAVQRTYAWGLDMSGTLTGAGGVGGLLMIKSTGVGSHFYSYDGNGNVVNLVAATDGTESARYDYDSFGIILRATGTMAAINPYRFSTKRQEAKTDVILYEYRPYSPSLGRWLSRDPIEEEGGINLYGFIHNNTLTYWDYLGADRMSNLDLLREELGEESYDVTQCKQFVNIATAVLNETPIGQAKIAATGKGLTDGRVSGTDQVAAAAGFVPWERALQLASKGLKCCKRIVVCAQFKYRLRKVEKRLPDWTVSPGRKDGSIRFIDTQKPQSNRVRVDKGNPDSPFPAQRVDHVVIQCDGRTLLRDGTILPPNNRIDEFPTETHIPLSEWLKWRYWNKK